MKSLLTAICILTITGVVVGNMVGASDEGTVTATVTIGDVSVTVDPVSFNYGTMPFNASKESFDVVGGGSNNIKATVGSVVTDLDIMATSTAAWTLASSVGANQYMHEFATSTDQTTQPAGYAALTNDYGDNVLVTAAAADSDTWFGLKIHTPTSGTTDQQSAVVSIRATWGEE